ncbi:MAG: hypothetical protein DRQ47_00290 [Gammaproteobacteria bacterium]|nr:MAG: hypothetical protein DRQ47_00290 [Gammaproteobacteria bacterium]
MPVKDDRKVVHIGSNTIGSRKRADTSRQTPDEDSFKASPNSIAVIATPYSLQTLTQVVQESSILGQCIEAMIVNTASSGYMVVPTDPTKSIEDVDLLELETLTSFIRYANPNQGLTTVNELLKSDYETYGYSFREIIRARNGKVSNIRYAPAYNLRILSSSEGYVEVVKKVERGGVRSTVREHILFRRFVQELSSVGSNNVQLSNGRSRVYFKEFGDPRKMDYRNGRYETDQYTVETKYVATEILHERQKSPDAYGIPKWTAALPAILGTRESEEVNLDYFENNTVPPAMLTVSGGRLTQKSFESLQLLLSEPGQAKDRAHQMILVEAISESNGLEEDGNVTIKLEKLTDIRQSDGLFDKYETSAQSKVRSIFRLPPIVIGLDSGNYANANTSLHVAETQVFQPDRRRHDDFWNMNIVNHQDGLNLKSVKLQSLSMSVTESSEVIKSLATLNISGAVTPRKAVIVSRDLLGIDLAKYPEKDEEGYEDWMDQPLALSTRSTTENLPETSDRPSESSPEEKVKIQEETGNTPDPENSDK